MVDFKIVKELHDSLISGQADKQTFAAEHIRYQCSVQTRSSALCTVDLNLKHVGWLAGTWVSRRTTGKLLQMLVWWPRWWGSWRGQWSNPRWLPQKL